MNGDGFNVTRAELYDAYIQYVVGDHYVIGKENHRKSSIECVTVFCKSIEISHLSTGIRLKIILERSDEEQTIFYNGKYFIAQEGGR